MQTQKANGQTQLTVQVSDSLNVQLFTNKDYDFLMDVETVAIGYGVSPNTIRGHKGAHKDELLENQHWVKGVCFSNTPNNQPDKIYWTKKGVIKLGFFIKSERAKAFRSWAENVILEVTSTPVNLPATSKRKDNRLTQERLLDIMQDVILIEDKDVRLSITNKLMNS